MIPDSEEDKVFDTISGREVSVTANADFRAIVDISPFPVLIHHDGIILYANKLVSSLIKLPPEQSLQGRHFADFIHADDLLKLRLVIDAHREEGILPSIMTFRFVDSEGAVRPAQFKSAPIQYEGKTCRFVYGYNFDKAEQAYAALRDREMLIQKLTEILPDHLVVINSYTHARLFENKPLVTRLGYDPEDYQGMDEIDFLLSKIHPDDVARIHTTRKFLGEPQHQGQLVTTEYRVLDKSGKWRWMNSRSSQLSPAEQGTGTINFGIVQDVTDVKEKEIALINYQKFLENVFKASPVLITIMALENYKPIYRSFNFGDWFGYDFAEDKTLIDIVHPDYYTPLIDAIKGMPKLQDGEILSTLFPFIKGDGSIVHLLSRTTVFQRDDSGEVTQVLIAHSDVTDLKAVESKLDKSEVTRKSILHAIPDTVFAVNTEGTVVDFYPNEDQEVLLETESLLGKNILDILPSMLHDAALSGILQTITTRKITTLEYEETSDGESSYFELRISPLSATEVIIIVRDISDIKQSERKLDRYNTELLEKNSELERYITSNSELEKFAYIASHDLREPLRSLIGFAQLLHKRNEGLLSAESEDFIENIITGAQRMNTLVNGLLEYSRISTAGKAFEQVSINDLLRKVQSDLRTAIDEHHAQIIVFDLPALFCDELQIRQLFQNLISNSIKFAGNRDPIIKISCEQQERYWLFKVEDNGIGMDMKYKEKVFQIFTRLHAQDKYQGSGIGLSVCKKIAERHGGIIWLESSVGNGTTIYFTIAA